MPKKKSAPTHKLSSNVSLECWERLLEFQREYAQELDVSEVTMADTIWMLCKRYKPPAPLQPAPTTAVAMPSELRPAGTPYLAWITKLPAPPYPWSPPVAALDYPQATYPVGSYAPYAPYPPYGRVDWNAPITAGAVNLKDLVKWRG